MQRCTWVGPNKPHYELYHDTEWGIPLHDDQRLFEMLILEGAQAGLNWETILKRREAYRQAFKGFDPKAVAAMSDQELLDLIDHSAIIRNRLKIFSARKNAQAFLSIQEEFGSFDHYIWGFVNHSPIINHPKSMADIPASTDLSLQISKDLKKRGMSFIGSTIIYAYMQAIGMVNDHMIHCMKK